MAHKGLPGGSQPEPLLARTNTPWDGGETVCASHTVGIGRRGRRLMPLPPRSAGLEQHWRAPGMVEAPR